MKNLCFLLVTLTLLSSYKLNAQEPVTYPNNINQAVVEILKGMSDEDKEKIKATPRNKLIRFHHGWGTGIRNSFGLWKGNNELIISSCGYPCHPDDASMKIIEAVWLKLNVQP